MCWVARKGLSILGPTVNPNLFSAAHEAHLSHLVQQHLRLIMRGMESPVHHAVIPLCWHGDVLQKRVGGDRGLDGGPHLS